jgi:hypothetical protein
MGERIFGTVKQEYFREIVARINQTVFGIAF